MISRQEQPLTDRQVYDGIIKRNTKLLEHVIQEIYDPRNPRQWCQKLVSNLNLTIETQIRFDYEGTRYIVYHSGHVTIVETGVEIGGMVEAQIMEDLLDIKGKGING